ERTFLSEEALRRARASQHQPFRRSQNVLCVPPAGRLRCVASSVPTILYATLLAGQYKTPAIYAEVKAVFTNTAPVDAYRGA
ncbi:molybdopterin cofactor-binding domain-containing protein, partial [Chromohalobacter sp. HP20-39]|uniref:molybdopterin cofactor-binding domain-containing protein n=1 Tax=Chromohalobacter sp. HP20-39 TaxID=3079306 RepID=UPI00294AA866